MIAPGRLVAAAQLGITIASLALGDLGEDTVRHIIEPWLSTLPEEIIGAIAGSLPLVISLIIITSLHVVLGEQTPKVMALRAPERVALILARPMNLFARIFWPFVRLLDVTTATILRLFGVRSTSLHRTVYTIEDLKYIVGESHREGVLEADAREMLYAVFDFGHLAARQVMVPMATRCGRPLPMCPMSFWKRTFRFGS